MTGALKEPNYEFTKCIVKKYLRQEQLDQKSFCAKIKQNEGDFSSWLNGKRKNKKVTERVYNYLINQANIKKKTPLKERKVTLVQPKKEDPTPPTKPKSVKKEEEEQEKEDGRKGYIYVMTCLDKRPGEIKIGRSNKPFTRVMAGNTWLDHIVVQCCIQVNDASDSEQRVHKELESQRIKRVGGRNTEWFKCSIETGIKACLEAKKKDLELE